MILDNKIVTTFSQIQEMNLYETINLEITPTKSVIICSLAAIPVILRVIQVFSKEVTRVLKDWWKKLKKWIKKVKVIVEETATILKIFVTKLIVDPEFLLRIVLIYGIISLLISPFLVAYRFSCILDVWWCSYYWAVYVVYLHIRHNRSVILDEFFNNIICLIPGLREKLTYFLDFLLKTKFWKVILKTYQRCVAIYNWRFFKLWRSFIFVVFIFWLFTQQLSVFSCWFDGLLPDDPNFRYWVEVVFEIFLENLKKRFLKWYYPSTD